MKITYTDLVGAIVGGELDSNLERLIEVARSRKDELVRQESFKLRAQINIGDTVYFKGGRPAYLHGAKVIVRKMNPVKVVVDMVTPMGKWNKNITCPPELLSITKPV